MLTVSKLDWFFNQNIEDRKKTICVLFSRGYTLDSLLTEVNDNQLCLLVETFRETVYWKPFLVALLYLSPEIWDRNDLFAERLQTYFEREEVQEILRLHGEMLTEGKQSPIVAFLQFASFR